MNTNNEWADFWRDKIHKSPIPADTQNKKPSVEWKQYQNDPPSKEQHEKWKAEGAFDKGMAIIAGKVSHAELYLILVDLDNQKAIDEFCTRNGVTTPLSEVAKHVIVEQHKDDLSKAHIIFYATHPFSKKSSDVAALSTRLEANQVPAIEVKGAGEHGLLYCTPSIHKNGYNYEIIGTTEPETVDEIESHIDNICSKYGIPYLNSGNGNNNSNTPIQDLFHEDTKIYEGHNRHEALLRVMESLLRRNYGILTEQQIKELAIYWNKKHCVPPLDEREFNKQWHDATKFVEKKVQEADTYSNENQDRKSLLETNFPDLKDNVYYRISEKPRKFILSYGKTNHLVEVTTTTSEKEVAGGSKKLVYNTIHNKTFLTCIPTKIIRHKNPLTFLELMPKYSISFVDRVGERTTFSHKTMSEIISCLRDLGYVNSDGAEGALGAMVQAYKERKEIEDNEDMDYLGFFTDKDNKIIASNIEINDPAISSLDDALLFIEELKPYFENRLDLLSTSIVWGMIAPIVFMLKTNNYFLKWLLFYGFPNATKSNTGKIVLAIDGHHDNPDFLLNLSRIDTIARLGDVVSHTTFPKLVDEVDLNGKDREWLVNALKSAIESRIARSKFLRNNSTSSTGIPALSPLILTSNPPPPFHDSGYMRRIIERNFPNSETWKETDPVALQFKEFLRINLKRLKALGDFRNWYIMNNQVEILDEARIPPLDLGYKILSEAYKVASRAIPEWLMQRLPENQLEESLEDNSVIVKRAFEKYIDENITSALSYWKAAGATIEISQYSTVSYRLEQLADGNFLPDIKKTQNGEIIIRKGILLELYKHGMTRDQCPNLKALADYINASYRKNHGLSVVACTPTQLHDYFDKIEALEES